MGLSFGFPLDVSCSTQFRRPISVPVIGGTASLWVPGSPIVDSLYFSSYSKLGSLTILGDAKKAPDWVASATAGSMGYAGHFGIPGCVYPLDEGVPFSLSLWSENGEEPGSSTDNTAVDLQAVPCHLGGWQGSLSLQSSEWLPMPTLKAEGSDLKVRWGQFTFWPHLPVGVWPRVEFLAYQFLTL